MPTFSYRCSTCDEITEVWRSIHAATERHHACPCGGSARQLLIGNFAPSALENKGAEVRAINRTERTWDKDRPAYKRLRMNGMQPPHVDGSDRLEALAENDLEVNTGLRYGKIPERSTKERVTEAKESGWVPTMKEVSINGSS